MMSTKAQIVFGFPVLLVSLMPMQFISADQFNGIAYRLTNFGNCSNHCSQEDKDLTCWDIPRRHYEQAAIYAVKTIRDYTAVLIDIDQWNFRHTDGYCGLYCANNVSTSSDGNETEWMTQFLDNQTSVLMEGAYNDSSWDGPVLDWDSLRGIVKIIYNQVNSSSATGQLLAPPEFTCPIPCSYETNLTHSLFIASVILNVLLVIGFVLYAVSQERTKPPERRKRPA